MSCSIAQSFVMTTTPKQNLILLRLAVIGAASAEDIKLSKKPKQDRDPLVKAGLVSQSRQGKRLHFELTERGWALLDGLDGLPLPETKRAVPVLEALFAKVALYLRGSGESLAALDQAPSGSEREPSREMSVPDRIRRAYDQLSAHSPGCDVRLKHLRGEIFDTDRETLDLCLLGLVMAGRAQLRQIDDPQALDEADRTAALSLGTDRHLFRLTA
jgi:hypothetical protein